MLILLFQVHNYIFLNYCTSQTIVFTLVLTKTAAFYNMDYREVLANRTLCIGEDVCNSSILSGSHLTEHVLKIRNSERDNQSEIERKN